MDFEEVFAAEVFRSATQATILLQRGIGSSASDFVELALMDLWQMSPLQAQVIADRYVFWDANSKPWERPVASRNVVSLRCLLFEYVLNLFSYQNNLHFCQCYLLRFGRPRFDRHEATPSLQRSVTRSPLLSEGSSCGGLR